MRLSPNNIFVKNVMENLMKEALIDVTPASTEICLMMPQQNGGKSNKKKRIAADKKFSKGRIHIANISEEQKVCAKALECLGFMLVYHGVLMKSVLFFILQEKITAIGFSIVSKLQQDGDLYRDPMCRSRLTDLITFLMTHPVHSMPVPINYGIALLTKMKNSDPDANVRNSASMNLNRAETSIHNRKDVFYFPSDYRDLRDTLLFNKQTINKFNEAVNGRNESTNGVTAIVKISPEPEANESENIILSDNDSRETEEFIIETTTASQSSEAPMEVNVISDEEEPEAQEISDEEEPIIVKPVLKTSVVKPTAEKRSSRSTTKQASPKKQKVADNKDEELLEEYLADFTDELV